MSAEVITLGCRLNIAESAAIKALLADAPDTVVVNSCAVTEEAVRQTRRAIRRARRARPDARILVTGCAAEIERAAFEGMVEVDGVVANGRKTDPASYRHSVRAEPVEALPSPFSELEKKGGLRQAQAERSVEGVRSKVAQASRSVGAVQSQSEPTHARAFLPVQNGCDHRCTFCIIPYGRGPSRSEPAGAVIDRVRALVEAGHREVVLTGVDVTSYGDLAGDSLGLLVSRILRHVPELPRLRLSSLDPVEIDERLMEIVCHEPRFMPHLHLSLQAGDDLILKRMKRRHLRADAIRLVERVKVARPEVAIGADIIAGFPTESDAAFDNSLQIVEECDIVYGHIFPYSPRAGTPAARMPQVPPPVVKDRARRLREACEARQARWLETLVGTTQRVLVELDGVTGHAENFAKVEHAPLPLAGGAGGGSELHSELVDTGPLPAPPASERGDVVSLRILARQNDTLIGAPA